MWNIVRFAGDSQYILERADCTPLKKLSEITPTIKSCSLARQYSDSIYMVYKIIITFLYLLIPADKFCVNISERFSFMLMYVVLNTFALTPSLTFWYATLQFFSFSVDYGTGVLHNTYWLSPYINHGLFTGIPNIVNLYLSSLRYSQHLLKAMDFLPK